jgi:hypothetical protein
MMSAIQHIDWWSIIIGAILAIVIPWLIKFVSSLFRPTLQKYHLSLLKNGEESTFTSSNRESVTVDVKYNGERYDGVISVLNIELNNDGQYDISFIKHFNRPIHLRSSKYKIIDAYTVNNGPVKALIEKSEDNSFSISWDLLKRKESIRIQLIGQLIETESSSKAKGNYLYPSFFESLQFNVRSDCVDFIKPKRLSYKMMATFFTVVIILMASVHIFFSLRGENNIKEYAFVVNNNTYTRAISYDSYQDCFVLSPRDSIKSANVFDFNKHPEVMIRVYNTRGIVAHLLLGYLSFIVMIWILSFFLHLANKREDKKKVFDE